MRNQSTPNPELSESDMSLALNLENANRRSAATRTGLFNPPAFPLLLNRRLENQRLNMSAPVEDVARDSAIMTRSETSVLLTVWEREDTSTPQYVCKRWYASQDKAQAAQEFFLEHGLEEYKRRAGLEFGAREWMA
jgi:hypothetical protein